MALTVEPRVYALPSVTKTVPVRPQKFAGALTDSAQKNAQSFIETLPPDVRERVGQLYKEAKKHDRSGGAEQTGGDKAAEGVRQDEKPSGIAVQADFRQPIFTQPILTPNAALLQVQLAANDTVSFRARSLSRQEHEAFHTAYLNAGAQAGGRAAALAAQIAREELSNQTLIVSPVLTTVNLSA